MHTIRPSFVIALALSIASSLVLPLAAKPRPTQAPGASAIRFEFEVKRDADLTPHSRVFVQAGGKRTVVLSSTAVFEPLSRADFAERKIPRAAIAACTGWWAGAGDNLYVVRRGERLDVYRQEMDEQAGPFPFLKIKSIRSPRTR